METEAAATAAPEPSCSFCAMDGFCAAAPIAMLAPERDGELRRAHPELHARLFVGDVVPCGGTTDDGLACTLAHAVALFVKGEPDGVDAGVCRRSGLFRADETYFPMPSHRLASLSTAAAVSVCCLSGDGRIIGAVERRRGAAEDGATVTVRSAETGAKLREFALFQAVTSLSLSGDGKTLLTVEHGHLAFGRPAGDATVTLRSVETGAQLAALKSEAAVTAAGVFGEEDGRKTLLTVARDRLRVTVRTPAAQLLEFESDEPVSSFGLSGDGKTLVTVEISWGDHLSVVRVRNVATGALRRECRHDQYVTGVCLSGDGGTLATVEHVKITHGNGAGDAIVTVRNVDTGAVLHEFNSEQAVTSVCLSADGKTLEAVEHGLLELYGRPDGDATITIRNLNRIIREEAQHE